MGMEIGASKGKKGRSRPEMNVTPLVDVVLVLLIIFMVVAPAMNALFWVHVPSRENQDPTPPAENAEPPIVVSVNEQGRIQINRDVYPDDLFPTRLRRMLIARGERRIFFDANDDTPLERAVEVLDLARGGGAAHIAVMTDALQ